MELPFFGTYYNFLKEYSDRRRSPRHTRAAQAHRAATTKFQEKNTPEIRRFPSARPDASFLNRPMRYGVLYPRGRYVVLRPCSEMRRSWTARWDMTFFVRAARSVALQPPGEIRRSSAGRRDTTFCRSAVDLMKNFENLLNTHVKIVSLGARGVFVADGGPVRHQSF